MKVLLFVLALMFGAAVAEDPLDARYKNHRCVARGWIPPTYSGTTDYYECIRTIEVGCGSVQFNLDDFFFEKEKCLA